MEIRNRSDGEFKTLAITMLEELSEDLNSIKKTQSEMKHTLIDIAAEWMRLIKKNNNNNNDLEHKEEKNK